MSAAVLTSWRDRPISELKVPRSTKKHMKDSATMPSGDPVENWGDVWDAIEEGHDIGLGGLQEKIRAQIEEAKNLEDESAETPVTISSGDKSAMVTAGQLAAMAENPETISPEVSEVLSEAVQRAAAPRVACQACHGSGLIEETRCPGCNGEGMVIDQSAAVEAESEPDFSDHEMLEQIRSAREEVKAAETEMEARHEDYKDAKKTYEASVERLLKVIDRSKESDEPNLFSNTKRPVKERGTYIGDDKDDNKPAPDPRLENLWREYPLERYTRFDLASSVIQKLAEHSPPILTVGELADFTQPKAGGYTPKITDVRGIGKSKVQKIEDAGIAFWSWWNAGGQEDFAREKGLANGNGVAAGTGNEGLEPIDAAATGEPSTADATPADWAEPAPSDRPEA